MTKLNLCSSNCKSNNNIIRSIVTAQRNNSNFNNKLMRGHSAKPADLVEPPLTKIVIRASYSQQIDCWALSKPMKFLRIMTLKIL